MNAQAILSSFWIRSLFKSMHSKSGNDTTDKYERDIFWRNSNDKKLQVKLKQTWIGVMIFHVLSHQIQRDPDKNIYFLSCLRSMMNVIFVLIAKRVFSDVLDGVNSTKCSLALLGCSNPLFFSMKKVLYV